MEFETFVGKFVEKLSKYSWKKMSVKPLSLTNLIRESIARRLNL